MFKAPPGRLWGLQVRTPNAGEAVFPEALGLCQAPYPVGRDSQILEVLQEANVGGEEGEVVVAEVQVAQLAAVEELGGDLLNLVAVQIEALKVGEVADLDGDVGDVVVPQLKAG